MCYRRDLSNICSMLVNAGDADADNPAGAAV